ncbi:unnamed protein product [Pieris macdunnoughi]|uniref:Uncharacterized protein n=1 Tax=Pieris macdunnoughi TaxID=345717 RepID=A0A821WZI6_9NEOP|nr:unnamed protein product [Pieris macdunnoughi]
MPASSINFYHMQDAKNNFDAIRPAPICSEANYFMGHCRNLHISTNCYYGYHNSSNRSETIQDTEMIEMTIDNPLKNPPVIENNTRKRCAEENEHSRSKRQRQEVQTMKKHGPETNENLKLDSTSEELMATLYWHIHGGNFYQCV